MVKRGSLLTPRMKRTLERAVDIARRRRHDYIGTEHVLLALLDDTDGIAGGTIRALGYEAAIREAINKVLDSPGYRGA